MINQACVLLSEIYLDLLINKLNNKTLRYVNNYFRDFDVGSHFSALNRRISSKINFFFDRKFPTEINPFLRFSGKKFHLNLPITR